jgi:hypothetical protein
VPQIQIGNDRKGKEHQEHQEEQRAWSGKKDENQVGERVLVPQGSRSSTNKDVRGFGKGKWHEENDKSADIPFCDRCKEFGHLIRECRRGQTHGGHIPQVARDLSLSEYIAPLCVAQVDGQAFFFIPDRPSEVHVRERATIAIVTILKGVVTTR